MYLEMIFDMRMNQLEYDSEIKRLTLKDPSNINSSLCFKGSFIEELETVLNIPEYIMMAEIQKRLYADSSLQFFEAGNPSDIKYGLTYEQVVQYY